MKRMLAWLLLIGLVAGLLGCQSEPAQTPTEQTEVSQTEITQTQTAATEMEINAFSVGYAKVDVTPDFSVPLNGYGNIEKRMSTGFLDRVYATCMAVTDARNETVLLFAYDMAAADPKFLMTLRASVSQTTGIPQNSIMLTASHSHSAPAVGSTKVPVQAKYDRQLVQWMTQLAVDAMADRKEAQMQIGSVEIVGQNFVRHYQLNNGTSVGYSSMISNNAVAHQGIGDYTMQLLKFTREGGKDVLMANWQCHPHRTGGSTKYDISADIVGVLRDTLEETLDCNFMYVQGAAGNMNPTSLLPDEKVADSYIDQGQQIAQFVIDAGDDIYTQVQTGNVEILRNDLDLKVDHTEDYLLPFAMEVQAVWTATNDRATADALGQPNGIRSAYHAGRIIANNKLGDLDTMEINAISFGDVAIVTAGYEMFCANGLYIKENSPYKMTIIMGYCNDNNPYIPSIDSFAYEAYENDQCRYEPGAGEMLAETFVNMLKELQSSAD